MPELYCKLLLIALCSELVPRALSRLMFYVTPPVHDYGLMIVWTTLLYYFSLIIGDLVLYSIVIPSNTPRQVFDPPGPLLRFLIVLLILLDKVFYSGYSPLWVLIPLTPLISTIIFICANLADWMGR